MNCAGGRGIGRACSIRSSLRAPSSAAAQFGQVARCSATRPSGISSPRGDRLDGVQRFVTEHDRDRLFGTLRSSFGTLRSSFGTLRSSFETRQLF